ncbi:serine protease [Arthrospira platensis BEA 1257B]
MGGQIENRQKLEQSAAEGAEFRDAGSGVIVARRNATYYVLTNEHVVRNRNNYSIRTHDGDLHQVENMLPPYLDLGQQDTTKDTVTHFGKYNHQKKTVDGYDLALISFQSNNNYPVAVVGDANTTTVGTPVFVSGWPLPSNPSQDRTRVLRAGELQQILDPADPNGNYNLCYTAETARGMSGGPVFNDRGEVIGVHGEGKDNQRPQCFDVRLGIKINDFIDAQEQKGQYRLKNDLRFLPPTPQNLPVRLLIQMLIL